ncbi:cytochrome c biogenesis factor [Desulfobacter hydrogenophilus]|uniref:Cytochrome c biogenesis factor n=1 Tax=Desulfobacter hydrogenophilus TaxID=2291 RepID=A0A328FA50_9BACT|nr:tetratricopeptide repeat protein [Desulfobacter hydrogenophilus]NDY72656.1 tetratricopeptide repeat protein [Desulfobacter hydrogenophilus]QBH14525.1 tetratricopeptide repeat protein [Desulfobacter hydrogenophilus]RAM01418.1 cytochrome c biogenesis factor [Desulfobacter hydrogenophilus]
MNQDTKKENMITRQAFYISILISLTLGFLMGTAYTSLKLADSKQPGIGQMPPAMMGNTPKGMPGPEKRAGGNQKPGLAAMADPQIKELQAFLKENPDNAQAWIKLGNAFFDLDRFGDAINAYEKSLSIEPDHPHVLTDLGVMYRRNNEPEKALKAFSKAVVLQPDFEIAWFNKGIVYMHDLNDIPKAIEAWEQLVKVNPTAQTSGGTLVSELIEKLKTKGR